MKTYSLFYFSLFGLILFSDYIISKLNTAAEIHFLESTLVDERDGQTYKTIQIGNQIWMAENLNFEIEDSECYELTAQHCLNLGRLYKWDAAKNACPNGWRLPSDEDWKILLDELGGYADCDSLNNCGPSGNHTNLGNVGLAFGAAQNQFGIQFGGSKRNWTTHDEYGGLDSLGIYWSSTSTSFEIDSQRAFVYRFNRIQDFTRDTVRILRYNLNKTHWNLSCRCIKEFAIENNRTKDSLALVDLYIATDGDNWTNSWDLEQSIDTWFGVTVNDNRVEFLNLADNGLSGKIPKTLGNLTSLINLDLQNNRLEGEIPNTLGNLTNLTRLHLQFNKLSDSIPSELGCLNNLLYLSLAENELTGSIPVELSNLTKLVGFYLNVNSLEGTIPEQFGDFSALVELYLDDNKITGEIPNSLGRLSNIKKLRLSINDLYGEIPPSIGSLPNLEILWLQNQGQVHSENKLSGSIPTELGNLPAIKQLIISNNNLTGPVPASLVNLSNTLSKLELHNNNLSGCFPSELDALCDINPSFNNNPQLPWQGLFSRFCNAEEQLGASCDDGNFETLNDVILQGCKCGVETNTEISCRQRDSLELIRIYNSIGGEDWTFTATNYSGIPIPNRGNKWDFNSSIDTWHGIELDEKGCVVLLALNSNGLEGELIAINLNKLKEIHVYDNELYGSIPNFSNLPNLEVLSCGGNQLSGLMPNFINLPNLKVLICGDNQLNGVIPDFINLPNLESFYCHENQLSGAIPDFTHLTSLEVFFCNDNVLSGTIPNFSLSNLVVLVCRDNQLNGTIPNFSNLQNLKTFDCSNNLLEGAIPDFTDLPKLEILDCNKNQLSGDIPTFVNTPNLRVLFASDNNLTGCFPENYMDSICGLGYITDSQFGAGYSFINNAALPWSGDMERWCNGELQFGAFCEDGNPNTTEIITSGIEACECREISLNDFPTNPILTLNNDGYNDELVFLGLDTPNYKDNEIIIYSRMGKKVFSKSPYKNDWGGTDDKGRELPSGTYYFVLNFDNFKEPIKGYITLIRPK